MHWLGRYSFLFGFIMSKKREKWLTELSVRIWNHKPFVFFDIIIKLRSKEFLLGFPRDGTSWDNTKREVTLSRCPFVPGQGQEQKFRDKLPCPGTSRDKTTCYFCTLSKKKSDFSKKRKRFPFAIIKGAP